MTDEVAKRCSNEVRPSSARILPLQCKREAFHLIQQIPAGNLFPLSPQGEGKSPFSSPEAKDLLTLFGDLREEPLEREAVSAAATGLGPLWGPSKTDRDGSRERRWTRATGTQRRLSCGKYRASSGSNEVRAAFARGLELRVLYKLSAKESGEKILER